MIGVSTFVSARQIDWYKIWSISVTTWPWPEIKPWPWPFKVILYMVRRALKRQTRWYQNRCSTFKIKDFIIDKVLENFWILTPGDFKFDLRQKWPKRVGNDFSRDFERHLFFLYDDQEPWSWERSNALPKGGGKFRGAAKRGLKSRNRYALLRYFAATTSYMFLWDKK